jgi:hypothetical protein
MRLLYVDSITLLRAGNVTIVFRLMVKVYVISLLLYRTFVM